MDVRTAAQAEVDEVRQSAELAVTAVRSSATRFADCVHAIDSAPTLGAVLTLVAGCARLEAGRATVIIVRDGTLVTYPFRGDVSPEQATLALSAVNTRQAVFEGAAAAFPITLGGQVAAVLSTSAPSSPDAVATLDLLVRHAGRVLEAMTLRQITGVSPLPARPPEASAGRAP